MKQKILFTTKSKMADVIHTNYGLIPIISRFGIEFGFGNKTIEEVCSDKSINVWFVLEIINSYHNDNYFPEKKLQDFSTKLIIDYLSNTHSYYLDNKIIEIQDYINEMELAASIHNLQNIKLLNDFFSEYREELKQHLGKEDKLIFPYIKNLEKISESGKITKEIVDQIKENSIEKYEKTHDNLEVKLSDLKNLIIKFIPPVLCPEICQKLLIELFRLESDLQNHANIEEKVLIPKVKLLEKKILKQSENK
ncbi:MAG: hemerythrin domain-containing protein [Bacteroidales bacterium]|nr:hemerythrin domain-containing protein [Bacteroidales bacterium]